MTKGIQTNRGDSCWCFAIMNGKLAEIHFRKGFGVKGVYAHCYVKREEYKTKREQKMIDTDIKKHRFIWRNRKYSEVPRPPLG